MPLRLIAVILEPFISILLVSKTRFKLSARLYHKVRRLLTTATRSVPSTYCFRRAPLLRLADSLLVGCGMVKLALRTLGSSTPSSHNVAGFLCVVFRGLRCAFQQDGTVR